MSLGEANVRRCTDGKLGAVTRDGYSTASRISINLDAVMKVLLESSNIKYLILYRCGTVEYEFYSSLLCLNLDELVK